ncbi:unnamed protein product [Rhizophagus irregularis]|nr:unnamed protein product [Rhizophagus irregularis]CAB5376283.1 unnamed protein product [Rhizophagus irregularis]
MLYFTSDLSKVVILFSGFQVTSFHTFVLATLFVISLCWCERLFTYYYENAGYEKEYVCSISVYSTHQLVPISQDDDLPTLANKLDDELEVQPQSLIIENVNSDDEYDYQIHNDIVKYEQQSLVNK